MVRLLCLCGFLFGQTEMDAQNRNLPQAIEPYFSASGKQPVAPHAAGFIQRWLLLEPIKVDVKSNVVFTDSYLKELFAKQYFPKQMELLPKDGTIVKAGKEKLRWHALDSKLYNVKLFRFATSYEKPKYGVLFFAVTIIDCPEEVRDDVISRKLTLKKGRNILRGAVVNGPGMSDFCLRFIDAFGNPVRNFSIHVK